MGLADSGRAQQQKRGAVGDPAARGELADLGLVERGLGGEVEAVALAHGREVGDLDRHLDPPLVLAGDLALDEEGERLAQGHLAPRRLVERLSRPSRIAVSWSRVSRATSVSWSGVTPASPDEPLVLGQGPQEIGRLGRSDPRFRA